MQNKLLSPLMAYFISLLLISCGDDNANASTQTTASKNTSIKEIATIGDKIKFTETLVMCDTKNPKLMVYTIFMHKLNEKYKLSEIHSEIMKQSNDDCKIMSQSRNVTGKFIKTQKDSVKGTVYNYINFKVLSIDGKDFSGTDAKLWTISFPNAAVFKKVN